MISKEIELSYLDKCAIFIDGGYLNAILHKWKDLELDYLKLSNKLANKINARRLRTYYYNCLPIKREGDKQSKEFYESRKKFYDKINLLPRFEVKFGELQYIKGIYKQKKIDVLMSLDIVDKCFGGQIQHVILVVGDSDFIPAIEKAKDYGAIVHLFAHDKSINRALIGKVDEFYPLDKSILEDCKLDKQNSHMPSDPI